MTLVVLCSNVAVEEVCKHERGKCFFAGFEIVRAISTRILLDTPDSHQPF